MADSKRGDVSLAPTQCDPVCITCSDQGVTARVLEIFPDGTANVDTGADHIEQISVELVDAAVGDFVLTHAKVAIANVIQEVQASIYHVLRETLDSMP